MTVQVEATLGATFGTAPDVSNVLDDLIVAAAGLAETGQRAAAVVARTLRAHLLSLAFLRLRELRRDDDQTEVDHEERTNLWTT